MSAAANISRCADILTHFGQVVPVQPAVPVRQRRRPYKLSGFVNRFHLGTGWWRVNTFRERSSAGLRRRTEWRVCRAQIVRSLDAYISGRLPQLQAAYISATALFTVLYYKTRTCLIGRQHFMQAHIFCGLRIFYASTDVFMDLEYFMSANIFIDADISGRQHFRAPTF